LRVAQAGGQAGEQAGLPPAPALPRRTSNRGTCELAGRRRASTATLKNALHNENSL